MLYEDVRLELGVDVAVLQFAIDFGASDPRELLAAFLAAEAIAERDVRFGVAVGVDKGLVESVVPKLIGVGGASGFTLRINTVLSSSPGCRNAK